MQYSVDGNLLQDRHLGGFKQDESGGESENRPKEIYKTQNYSKKKAISTFKLQIVDLRFL